MSNRGLGAWGLGLATFAMTLAFSILVALLILVAPGFSRGIAAQSPDQLPDPVATFSILGYDPETGEVGGAVAARAFLSEHFEDIGKRSTVDLGAEAKAEWA